MTKAQDVPQDLLKEYIRKLDVMNVADIAPADYNPRQDLEPNDPDFQALERSIAEFDQLEPLIWSRSTKRLVGGHQRLRVLKHLKREQAVVFVVETDEERERALNLALNKALGRWDPEKLMAMVDTLPPDMLRLGGFSGVDEAYEMMRAIETGESTNFLDDIIRDSGLSLGEEPAAGQQEGEASGEGGGSAPGPRERERKREIDMKEEHIHRTGEQYFDVILQLTAEQRAIFYAAVGRAKKENSTENTYEAVTYIMDRFNKKWEETHPSELAKEPEE